MWIVFTDQLEASEAMTSDFDGGIAKMEETKRRRDDKKRGRKYDKDGLLKGDGKVESLATFDGDHRTESVVRRGHALGGG